MNKENKFRTLLHNVKTLQTKNRDLLSDEDFKTLQEVAYFLQEEEFKHRQKQHFNLSANLWWLVKIFFLIKNNVDFDAIVEFIKNVL